jgi:hypothetical protein
MCFKTCQILQLVIRYFNKRFTRYLYDRDDQLEALVRMVMVRSDSVAGSPKVHGRDCLFRLHTMTVL